MGDPFPSPGSQGLSHMTPSPGAHMAPSPAPHPVPSPATPGGIVGPVPPMSKEALSKIVGFLQKTGMRAAEQALLREAAERGTDVAALGYHVPQEPASQAAMETSPQSILGSHVQRDVGALASFAALYHNLLGFVNRSFPRIRPELGALLFPVYAHMYLELVASEKAMEAAEFRAKFARVQDTIWAEDLARLNRTTTPAQLESNELVEAFSANPFHLKMSKESMGALKPLLETQPVLANLMRKHLQIESLDMAPRSKETIDASSGGLLGEVPKGGNKTRVFYGIPKDEPSTSGVLAMNEDDDGPSSKKKKSSSSSKDKKKNDPNAPPLDRIPLPEFTEAMKADRKAAQKDLAKRLKIGPDNLPSVCLYTVLNAGQGVCSAEISEDSTLAYLGFGNSTVGVHSLSPNSLLPLKSLAELELVDKEADDVESRMVDEKGARNHLSLFGHSGPVYGVSGSPDKRLLLSASADGSIRLWSLHLWTNLAVYKVAGFPVWDVSFCSRGYYFASGSADKLGMVWCTDRVQPLRLLAGHYSDVNVVEFHPNCNYVATGSADRSVRVWDMANGQCVRHFNGHKSGVEALRWSSDGRYLGSGGGEGASMVWDFAQGKLLSAWEPTGAPVASVAMSRDGTVLAAGGLDRAVTIHSLAAPDAKADLQPSPSYTDLGGSCLASFPTKSTPIIHLHWTRKNVLLGIGAFDSSSS